MQKGFVFDINKCTGCSACRLACIIENDLDPGMAWREVHTFNPAHVGGIPVFHHSLACNHCNDPPCLTNCPASAYSKDPISGAVLVDGSACIGCKYCSWACPFDAPKLNPSTRVMEKCTMCKSRIDVGRDPACVALCPTGALGFGDLEPRVQKDELGFPRTSVRAAIEFVPLQRDRVIPEIAAAHDGAGDEPAAMLARNELESTISPRSEWSLLVFSQIVAWLTGYLAAVLAGQRAPSPWVFAVLGLVGVAASSAHLGRPKRAPRAVLNWRQSWLSREIILTTLFVGLGMVWLSAPSVGARWGWIAVVAGFGALLAMDRVYHVTGTRYLGSHSAQTALTGAYAAGLLAWNGELIVLAGGIKLLLYGMRKHRHFIHGSDPLLGISAVRIGLGVVIPAGLWIWGSPAALGPAVAAALIGETIDRCEFYTELYATTPRRQLILDLRAAITRGVERK